MSRLWLTRPRADSEAMAATLRARGIDTILAPVMMIAPCSFQLPQQPPASLLLTSRHAAEALPAAWRHVPVYAVGDATADAVRAQGYAHVIVGGGNALELLPAIVAGQRDVLHLSGAEIKLDLAPLLASQGIALQRCVVYEAQRVTALDAALIAALRSGSVRGVVFYSPHTVRMAQQLLEEADAMAAMAQVDAFCLSLDIAQPAAALGCAAIFTCALPTQQAMMELLTTHAIRAA